MIMSGFKDKCDYIGCGKPAIGNDPRFCYNYCEVHSKTCPTDFIRYEDDPRLEKISHHDISVENLKRAHNELPLWNNIMGIGTCRSSDVPTLTLKRIFTQAKHINDHEHTEIDPLKTYLVCDSGKWHIGKFKRKYHNDGWEMDFGSYCHTMAGIHLIYEVYDLPEISERLIELMPYRDRDEDDYDY